MNPLSRTVFAIASLQAALIAHASAHSAVGQSGSAPAPFGPGTRASAPPEAKDVVKIEHAGNWRDAEGRLLVGIRFTMSPKWHIYWSNPGDSGLPPQMKPTLPSGWSASEVIYPRPDVIVHDGETNFGYDDLAVLMLPLVGSDAAKSGPATIDLRFLVCKGVCLGGDGRVEVVLPEFAAVAALPLLPEVVEGRSFPKSLDAVKGRATLAGEQLRIEGPVASAPGITEKSARFLPFDFPGFTLPDGTIGKGRVDAEQFRIELPVSLDPNDAPAQVLRAGGLVILGGNRSDPCFDFTLQVADTKVGP